VRKGNKALMLEAVRDSLTALVPRPGRQPGRLSAMLAGLDDKS